MRAEKIEFFDQNFSENYFFRENYRENSKKILLDLQKMWVFRRSHVLNDPINWTDPSGLDRRRCSRPLRPLTRMAGPVRHDYAEFRDSKGNRTTKSWGPNGQIQEDGAGATCDAWKNSSDAQDKRAQDFADVLGDVQDYSPVGGYNCQDYTRDVLNHGLGF